MFTTLKKGSSDQVALVGEATVPLPRTSRSRFRLVRNFLLAHSISIRVRGSSTLSSASLSTVRFSLGKSKAPLTTAFPLTHMQYSLSDSCRLYWIEHRGEKQVRYDTEPDTSFWMRAAVWFLSLLPIDWLL